MPVTLPPTRPSPWQRATDLPSAMARADALLDAADDLAEEATTLGMHVAEYRMLKGHQLETARAPSPAMHTRLTALRSRIDASLRDLRDEHAALQGTVASLQALTGGGAPVPAVYLHADLRDAAVSVGGTLRQIATAIVAVDELADPDSGRRPVVERLTKHGAFPPIAVRTAKPSLRLRELLGSQAFDAHAAARAAVQETVRFEGLAAEFDSAVSDFVDRTNVSGSLPSAGALAVELTALHGARRSAAAAVESIAAYAQSVAALAALSASRPPLSPEARAAWSTTLVGAAELLHELARQHHTAQTGQGVAEAVAALATDDFQRAVGALEARASAHAAHGSERRGQRAAGRHAAREAGRRGAPDRAPAHPARPHVRKR